MRGLTSQATHLRCALPFTAGLPTARPSDGPSPSIDTNRRCRADQVFIALTGARFGEAFTLKWEYVEGARAILPDSKTGPKTLWLPSTVQALIHALPRDSSYVFGEPTRRAHRRLERLWGRIRIAAGLNQTRLHDLRHGYASIAVSQGEELRTVAELLGHADFGTTLGYVHLAEAPSWLLRGAHLDTLRKRSSQLHKWITSSEKVRNRKPLPTSSDLISARDELSRRFGSVLRPRSVLC